VLVGNNARDDEATSAKPTTHGPISSIVSEQSKPFIADWVLAIVPPSRRRGRKHPPPATKWFNPIPPIDKVMTQVELPPYCGPRSPLDLIAIEFVFGCIFEPFQQISQAAAAGATPADDNKPLKRFCQPPLNKALVSRYSYILFHYFAGHLMPTSHQKPLSRSQLMCWRHLLGLLLLLPLLWRE
jgi:hypothetical protein